MLRGVKWLSPPGSQVSVINASGCGNEREEDLKERKWVVRNGGVKISHSCHHAEDKCFHMFGNNMANLVENFDDLFACVGVTILY